MHQDYRLNKRSALASLGVPGAYAGSQWSLASFTVPQVPMMIMMRRCSLCSSWSLVIMRKWRPSPDDDEEDSDDLNNFELFWSLETITCSSLLRSALVSVPLGARVTYMPSALMDRSTSKWTWKDCTHDDCFFSNTNTIISMSSN